MVGMLTVPMSTLTSQCGGPGTDIETQGVTGVWLRLAKGQNSATNRAGAKILKGGDPLMQVISEHILRESCYQACSSTKAMPAAESEVNYNILRNTHFFTVNPLTLED